MKNFVAVLAAFFLLLIASGRAMAYFEDGDLVRVVYTGSGSGKEYATDLGNFSTLTSPSSANTAFNTNNFSLSSVGASSWSDVYVAYFMVTSTAGGQAGNYVWTSGPLDGQTGGGRNKFSQFTSGAHTVVGAYQVAGGGAAKATLLQSDPASYWNIMNWATESGRGQMISFIPAGNADKNMADLSTTGYVDQYLYFYGTPNTSSPGTQIVLLRNFADGHTEFNPSSPSDGPSCTASFSPSTIDVGQTSTLSWSSNKDADGQIPYSCSGDLGTGILSGASGTKDFFPTTATQTCTLTVADRSGATNTCNAKVDMGSSSPSSASCNASFSPVIIVPGKTSTLSWSSSKDADGQIPYTCTGDLGAGTLSGASGSKDFSPAATQTCTLTVADSSAATSTCTGSVTVVFSNNCGATWLNDGQGLSVHIPVISYGGSYYWLEMQYIPNTADFRVSGAGLVADMSKYSNCVSSTLDDNFSLHVPQALFLWFTFGIDFRYSGQSIFSIAN